MTYSSEVLADSPDGFWLCDGGFGAPLDSSGNGYDAVLASGVNTYVSDGVLGTVLDADAGSWTMPLTLGSPAWTIEYCAKVDSGGDFVAGGGAPGGRGSFQASDTDTSLNASTGGPPTSSSWSRAASYTWHHYAGVWDGSDLYAYVDGVQVSTTPYAPGSFIPSAGCYFHSSAPAALVYGIAFYPTALTALRVAAHYSALPSFAPAEPASNLVDDFNRADGALGTSLLSIPWDTLAVNELTIASNAAAPTLGTGWAVLPWVNPQDPDPPVDVPHFLSGTLTLGASPWEFGGFLLHDGYFGVGFNGSDSVPFSPAICYSLDDDRQAKPEAFPAVDLTAGTHTFTIQVESDTTNWVAVTLWWDGVYINSSTCNATQAPLGGGIALYASGDVVLDDISWAFPPVTPPAIPAPSLLGGWVPTFQSSAVMHVGGLPAPALTGGPIAPQTGAALLPIAAGGLPAPPLIGGVIATWSNTPTVSIPPDPTTWPVGYYYGPPQMDLRVSGQSDLMSASCQPQMNAGGSGSYTVLPSEATSQGDLKVFTSGGSAIWMGVVSEVTEIIADQAEEAGQLVTATCMGAMERDFTDTIVAPDFGAYEPIRVGAPAQDDRVWGFPMNGLLPEDSSFTSSFENSPTFYGTPLEIFPVPPDWPNPHAHYMWDRNPDDKQAPAGWCYFRVPVGLFPGRYAIFLNAFDYAQLWIDGAIIATADQPGTTVRVEIEVDWDFHLIAIAAYNEGGKAGVAFSMQPIKKDRLGPQVMDSRAGWITLGYPAKPMRATIGKVLHRLISEAAARGAPAGQWSLSFGEKTDSLGQTWDNEVEITTKVGQTYWDAFNSAAEDQLDFWASPGSKVVHAVKKGTSVGGGAIPWTAGVDAESMTVTVGNT